MERILFFEGKKFKNRTVMLFYYDESGMKIWFLAFLIKKKKKKKKTNFFFFLNKKRFFLFCFLIFIHTEGSKCQL
jgi:hypothetical protein